MFILWIKKRKDFLGVELIEKIGQRPLNLARILNAENGTQPFKKAAGLDFDIEPDTVKGVNPDAPPGYPSP